MGSGSGGHARRWSAYADDPARSWLWFARGRRRHSAERDPRLRRRAPRRELTDARIVTVDIEELSPAGDGIATADRIRIAVPFTIPGERVRIQIAAPQRG